jgi:RNase P/RNase MRP subunit p29
MILRICFVAWIVTGPLIVPAWAAPRARPPQLQDVTVTGTLQSVSGGEFSVVADARGGGKTWVVFTDPNTAYHATGIAMADFLRPRLMVQFAADVDDSGSVQDKLGELTIVSPTPEHVPGIFQGEGGSANPAPAKVATKGKKKAVPAAPGGADNSKKAKVVGKVVSFKQNRLVVAAGKRKVEVDLTEAPLIHVDLAEGTFASAGDKVVVHGKDVKGKPGTCEAARVEITFAQPLTNPKKWLATTKAESHHAHRAAKEKSIELDEDAADSDAAHANASKKEIPAKGP